LKQEMRNHGVCRRDKGACRQGTGC
jgi:hypothetical protein